MPMMLYYLGYNENNLPSSEEFAKSIEEFDTVAGLDNPAAHMACQLVLDARELSVPEPTLIELIDSAKEQLEGVRR